MLINFERIPPGLPHLRGHTPSANPRHHPACRDAGCNRNWRGFRHPDDGPIVVPPIRPGHDDPGLFHGNPAVIAAEARVTRHPIRFAADTARIRIVITQEQTLDRYWNVFQNAMSCTTIAEIQREIDAFMQLLAFRNYGFASKASGENGGYHFCTNFGDAWAAQYQMLNTPAAERTDLRIIQAKRWHPPSGWNSLGQNSYTPPPDLRKALRKRLLMTGEFGIHSGITIPLRAAGIEWAFLSLTLSHRNHLREFDSALLIGTYFTTFLQSALTSIRRANPPGVTLSSRAIESLRWSALGKTSWEISQIEKISESTVNFHLQRAAAKLGVRGRRAAVVQALARGLIRL